MSQCLIVMPMTIILTKICPKHIEATSFALLAGVWNFSEITSTWMGSFINETLIGVTQEDLSEYWKLVTIGTVCSFLPILFIRLIPTQNAIENLQNSMRTEEEQNAHAKMLGRYKKEDIRATGDNTMML